MRPDRPFDVFLEAMREVGEEDLRRAMEQIPAITRETLALGPMPRRYDCRVCHTFGAGFYGGGWDATRPAFIVWGYHEAPKADMRWEDQLWHGELANEQYRRCILTYRLAGWTGEAEEANA